MFWDKWIPKKYLAKSEVCALEACFSEEGIVYYYTHLKNKSNKLEISETGFVKDRLELPPTILKAKLPIVLIINGKGIILKKISLHESESLNLESVIQQNLPAINPDDFFIQLYRQKDLSAFIVLCRKEQVNPLINELKNKKYDVANVLLGPPAIIGLEPLWNNHNMLVTSLNNVELTNGVVDAIFPTENLQRQDIKIEELQFSSDYTLGFAGALSYFMRRKIVENNSQDLNLVPVHHEEKNKLRFLMILAVGIAFAIAVVNVLFYTNYFDKNNKLETELGVYQGKYEQINQLLNDYQKNKSLIENAGILNRNKLSEFGDRIGKTLPDEVVLSELYFNPKNEKEESEDSLITFQNKHLVLKGNCGKSFIVNEWVNVLKMQKFIKDVSLERFTYSNEGLLPNFEIRLITE